MRLVGFSEPVRQFDKVAELAVAPSSLPKTHFYTLTDFAAYGLVPDGVAFYTPEYRPILRRMVELVVETEGPILEDLLIRRIARAHGFGRAAGRIQERTKAAIDPQFPVSLEPTGRVLWARGADTNCLPAFRAPAPGSEPRGYVDIPLPELASLAKRFLDQGISKDELPAVMGHDLGLERLREAGRQRLEQAASLALQQV